MTSLALASFSSLLYHFQCIFTLFHHSHLFTTSHHAFIHHLSPHITSLHSPRNARCLSLLLPGVATSPRSVPTTGPMSLTRTATTGESTVKVKVLLGYIHALERHAAAVRQGKHSTQDFRTALSDKK